MGEGALVETRGEFEKRVNVNEFISVEPKLDALNGASTTRENDRLAFCSRLIVPRGALLVLNATRFASGLNFEKELHAQYTIHRRMIPLA